MAEKQPKRPDPNWFDYIPVIGPLIKGAAKSLEKTRKSIEGEMDMDATNDGDTHNPTPESRKRTGQ